MRIAGRCSTRSDQQHGSAQRSAALLPIAQRLIWIGKGWQHEGMNGPSGADLLALRLAAAQRESQRIDALLMALHLTIDTIYADLVEDGWDAPQALAAVLLQLKKADERLSKLALPD